MAKEFIKNYELNKSYNFHHVTFNILKPSNTGTDLIVEIIGKDYLQVKYMTINELDNAQNIKYRPTFIDRAPKENPPNFITNDRFGKRTTRFWTHLKN
jgi:hypothetical protein